MSVTTSSDTLRNKTVRSIGWSVASQLGTQAIALATTIFLARLLSPNEFGLMAMVTVITSFAGIFAEMGFSAALVQKPTIHPEQLSSVFWLNTGIGLFLTLAFIVGAPLIGHFYGEPVLVPLTIFVSTNFIIGSLTIVQKTLMVKTLNFRALSIVDITAASIAGVVAIVLAYAGAGVWSLAIQTVLTSIVATVLFWQLGRWRPTLVFHWASIKGLMGFSLNLLGSQLLNYWVRNLDYLLIGRFYGTQPLGIYKNAYTIMLFPLTNVSRVISRVMFPSLSIIQSDKARVKNVFLRATRAIALITFPMMTGLFVVAEPFILTFFGPQWYDMIPIIQVFCFVGLIQSIGTLNGNLYLSQGRADLQFRVGIVVHLVAMAGIVIGLPWGALGVAVGYSIASLVNSYPSLYFAGKLVDLTYWQVWGKLMGILGCALGMAIAVWGLGLLLPMSWTTWIRLGCLVLFGLLVYSMLIQVFRLQAWVETRQLILEQVHQRNKDNTNTAIMRDAIPESKVMDAES